LEAGPRHVGVEHFRKPQSLASCEEIASTQGRLERLLHAWRVPRWITLSPFASCTSSASRTSVISPSRTRQKSSVRVRRIGGRGRSRGANVTTRHTEPPAGGVSTRGGSLLILAGVASVAQMNAEESGR